MLDIKIGADSIIASAYKNNADALIDSVEELGELSQACMKMLRASKFGGSVTPVTEEKAREDIVEELVDVYASLRLLCIKFNITPEEIEEITIRKQNRYADRLEERNIDDDVEKAEEIRVVLDIYDKLIKPDIEAFRKKIH